MSYELIENAIRHGTYEIELAFHSPETLMLLNSGNTIVFSWDKEGKENKLRVS
jgi:hypothetical protein